MTAPSALPLLFSTLLESVGTDPPTLYCAALFVHLLVLITIISFVIQTQKRHCPNANNDFDSERRKVDN